MTKGGRLALSPDLNRKSIIASTKGCIASWQKELNRQSIAHSAMVSSVNLVKSLVTVIGVEGPNLAHFRSSAFTMSCVSISHVKENIQDHQEVLLELTFIHSLDRQCPKSWHKYSIYLTLVWIVVGGSK